MLMKLKIADLIPYQQQLDQRIFDIHDTDRPSTMQSRLLALLVELGEFANETRCFKFWSVKGPSEKAVLAEEFGDGLHFFLSLGIDLDDDGTDVEPIFVEGSGTDRFLALYDAVVVFGRNANLDTYREAFGLFFGLADSFGLSDDDIRSYYLKKNEKNHSRQDQNY
jgi:dimeric dUTPase (all-alpha-NTP-PPase superfamily)